MIYPTMLVLDPFIQCVLESPVLFTGCEDVRVLEMLLLNLLTHRRLLLHVGGKPISRTLYSVAHRLLAVELAEGGWHLVGSAGPSDLLVERYGSGYTQKTLDFYRAFVLEVLEDETGHTTASIPLPGVQK